VARPDLDPVVITGGSSGLGRAVAHTISAAGGTPVVLDRQEPGADVEFEHVDLADARAAEAAVARIADRHDGVAAVVACAGTDACGSLADVPAEEWERVIAVNLTGNAAVVRAALPHLLARHGHVITVASTLGLRALPDATAYCASKFGLIGFTRALAAETAGRIGVTLLIPGGMATNFFNGRPDTYKPPAEARLNQPEHVAATVLFALSQPPGCEVRELVVTPSVESSWP
jgi:NAD(P)-dependent dehydrogenase (short-subunit alcohol dehydrogenase family)